MKLRTFYILLISWLFLAAAPIISDKATDNKDFVAGKAYYKKQDYTNARFYLLRSVREEPNNEQALLMLANLEERTRHYATAIVHLNDLLALNPYNEHFWRKKIGLYRLQGNDVEADRLLERICTIYPENESLQRMLQNRKTEHLEASHKQQRESRDVEGRQQGDKSKAKQAKHAPSQLSDPCTMNNEEVTDTLAEYAQRNAPEYTEDARSPEANVLTDSIITTQPEEAILMADSALAVNPEHEMKNYYKFQNAITVDYLQACRGKEDKLTANATVTYDRKLKNDDHLTAAITYSARDYCVGEDESYDDDNGNLITNPGTAPTLDNGGTGIQVKGEYEHKFSEKLTAKAGIGGANRYFPLLSLNAATTWNIRKGWSVGPHVAYRLSDASHNFSDKILSGSKNVSILDVGGDVGKDFGQFHYSGGADLFLIKSNAYFNAKSKIQYFPLENSRTHVFAAVAMGTAPELKFVDNALPTGFSHLNSSVSVGGLYSITSYFNLAANGTWSNLVNNQGFHKNYFYINAQFQILF